MVSENALPKSVLSYAYPETLGKSSGAVKISDRARRMFDLSRELTSASLRFHSEPDFPLLAPEEA
jgi:hypothetical protein